MISRCKILKTTNRCRISLASWPQISFSSYFLLMPKPILKIEKVRNKLLKLILKNSPTFFLKILNTFILQNLVRSFFLTWYNNQTHASATTNPNVKPLPRLCYNGFDCASGESNFLKKVFFIGTITVKYTKAEGEWLSCKTSELIW